MAILDKKPLSQSLTHSLTYLLCIMPAPPRGRPETASPERHLLGVLVPRLHRDRVQDGRPVEEGHLQGYSRLYLFVFFLYV